MKILRILLLCFLLCACDAGTPVYDLPAYTYEPEETVYGYVWLDDEVPADFDPAKDYLYLNLPAGKDSQRVYRVNPYSLRATAICTDPLCDHDWTKRTECPYYGTSPWNHADYAAIGDTLYYFGGQYAKVRGVDGTMVDSYYVGLNGYNMVTGEKTSLVDYGTLGEPVFGTDFRLTVWEDWIYYRAEVPTADESGKIITEEDGDPVTETRLFRVNVNGSGTPEDLGLFMGYNCPVIRGGLIWSYYGFFNENPFWANLDRDAVVVTDLNNENPRVVPAVTEAVDDVNGYGQAVKDTRSSAEGRLLLYTGDLAEPHVYVCDGQIMDYAEGWIWTTRVVDEEYEENGIIKSRQTDTVVEKKHILTGETVTIANPPVPDDGAYLNAVTAVDGRYVIYAVHGAINPAVSSGGALLYYLRLDTETGEVHPIYP